jgi:integrase
MAKRLTALKVEQAKPRTIRTEIPDGGCAGLYLVLQPSGRRSWAVRYRRKADGQPRKITLDGSLSLAAARAKASEQMEKVAKGEDPAAVLQIEKQAARAKAGTHDDTFGSIARKFIIKYARPKNRSWAEVARLLGLKPDVEDENELLAIKGGLADRWGKRKFSEIRKKDVIDLLDEIVENGGGISANRTLAALRKIWNWAASRDDTLPTSPCAGLVPPVQEIERDRVLRDDEIRWLWTACDKIGQPFGYAVKLLLLTGQRRGEVGEMTEREIDRDKRTWTIPAARAKNDAIHDVPLSDQALVVLDSIKRIKGSKGFIFTTSGDSPVSGWSKAKTQLEKLMSEAAAKEGKEMAPWRLHDLRRTVATGMQRIGIRLEVAEKVLNHVSGSFAGVVGVYQRHDFANEKRAALDAWAREVGRIVSGKTATVIQMPSTVRA